MLRINVTQVKGVWIEGMERDIGALHNMPLLNVRLTESFEELTSIPDGAYEKVTFLVDVIVFDLTSFPEAARLRSEVLRAAKDACRANRTFSVGLDTSSVQQQTTFGAAGVESDTGRNSHMAMATFTVVCEGYVG
jgi:hypothetical protein